MTGTILDVIDGGSIWLLIVHTGRGTVDQPVEPRYLRDIVEAERLSSPYDLEGRDIELSDDGLAIGLP